MVYSYRLQRLLSAMTLTFSETALVSGNAKPQPGKTRELTQITHAMRERQEIEQYFFDTATLDHLARFAARFPNPCCLCTPSLGAELEARGVKAVTLDIDERF